MGVDKEDWEVLIKDLTPEQIRDRLPPTIEFKVRCYNTEKPKG